MKILQISKFYWPVMGGIETVAWELAEGLNRAGLDVGVLCSHQEPRTVIDRFPLGYQVARAGSLGTVLSTSVAPAMVPLMRSLSIGCDIVHLHMPDPMAALALWLARPTGRVVVHWHSDVIRQRRAMKLYEPLQRWVLSRADAIVATSEAYAQASAPLQPWARKVRVIPIGISDNKGGACADKAAAVRQQFRGRRIVFSLGRMTYYKGFDVLIRAARALPDDCVVLIGGEGELLNHYRETVLAQGLAGKVHLAGHIDHNDLPSYFQACDVFCMPSTVRAEAYGVAMVEAMVMGKPIIATDIPGSGVPWVNVDGRTGFNVPVGDCCALAQALQRLLDDCQLRARLGAGARERFEQDFNAARMTDRTIDLYRSVLTTP